LWVDLGFEDILKRGRCYLGEIGEFERNIYRVSGGVRNLGMGSKVESTSGEEDKLGFNKLSS
jgi:hypothetical protein